MTALIVLGHETQIDYLLTYSKMAYTWELRVLVEDGAGDESAQIAAGR